MYPEVLLLFVSLHMAEEYLWPGGFAAEFKGMMARAGIRVGGLWLLLTNLAFLLLAISALLFRNEYFYTIVVAVAGVNGLLHLGKSILLRRYFPGLVTAISLYLPLTLYTLTRHTLTPGETGACVLAAVFLHALPLYVLTFTRLRV